MSAPLRTRLCPRGFTLVELLISLVLVAFLTAGAMALMGQQQRAFQNGSSDRALQETARAALSHISENLRRAGYGIEPILAIDFGPLNITTATPNIVTQSWQCPSAVTCRDGVAANNLSDEIVFHARDPAFGRSLAASPTTGSLTITGGLQAPLYQGQILQVMCSGAADWAYVTVGATVAPNWTPPAAPPATTAIPLGAASGSDAFPAQSNRFTSGSHPCFAANTPSSVLVLKVDRFRYYIGWFADPETPNGRPYLMLDRGLTDPKAGPEPVAPDIEDLQFAYVFPNEPVAANQVVGATLGTALTNSATSIDLTAAPPIYNTPDSSPSFQNHSPANIRAVKVTVVARTPGTDVQLQNIAVKTTNQSAVDVVGAGNLVPGSGNRGDWLGDSGHHRLRVDTTEATRNLGARVPSYPTYTTNGGADGFNFGGG